MTGACDSPLSLPRCSSGNASGQPKTPCLPADRGLLSVEFPDEAGGRLGHEVARQLDGYPSESADRLHRLQQIPAVAGPRVPAALVVTLVEEVHGVRALV